MFITLGVSSNTFGVSFNTLGVSFNTLGVSFITFGVSFNTLGVSFITFGVSFNTLGVFEANADLVVSSSPKASDSQSEPFGLAVRRDGLKRDVGLQFLTLVLEHHAGPVTVGLGVCEF